MANRDRVIRIFLSFLLGILIVYCPQSEILAQKSVSTTETIQSNDSNQQQGDFRTKGKLSDLKEAHQQIENDFKEIKNNIKTWKGDVERITWSEESYKNESNDLLNQIRLNSSKLSEYTNKLDTKIKNIKKNIDQRLPSVEENINYKPETLVSESKKKIGEVYEKAANIYKLIAEQKKLDAKEKKYEWLSIIEDESLQSQALDKLLHSAALYKQCDARISQAKALEYVARIKQKQKGSDQVSYYEEQKKSENEQKRLHERQQLEFEKKQKKTSDVKLEGVKKMIKHAGLEKQYPALFKQKKLPPIIPEIKPPEIEIKPINSTSLFIFIAIVIVATVCLLAMQFVDTLVSFLGSAIKLFGRFLPLEFRIEISLELQRQKQYIQNKLRLLQIRIGYFFSIILKTIPQFLWEKLINPNSNKKENNEKKK